MCRVSLRNESSEKYFTHAFWSRAKWGKNTKNQPQKKLIALAIFLLSIQFAGGRNADKTFRTGMIVTQASAELVRIMG